MLRTLIARGGILSFSMALLCGCGGGAARVTGEVTFEGQPVGDGAISFLPADGKGPAAGGPIVAGRYTVEDLTPGPKLVKIEAVKKVPFARSSEEMAKRAAVNKLFGDGSGIIDPADIIPPNAEGNNAAVEIKPGKQTHDFHLKKPAGKKDRQF